MKHRFLFLLVYSAALVFVFGSGAWAACDGADMTGGNTCLFYGGFGVVGGPLDGENHDLARSDMYPIQQRLPYADLAVWYDRAKVQYGDGYHYRQDLLLLDLDLDPENPPANPTPKQSMILNPRLNYETAGLINDIAGMTADLTTARDTFAYAHFAGYDHGDGVPPLQRLQETLKLMANIYLLIADEFLIDALESRFNYSADTWATMLSSEKMDDQLDHLDKARTYYQKAVNTFVYGFSPAVGTNIYISEIFDQDVFDLFHLSAERMSMTLREISSKQLARLISPNPLEEVYARSLAGDTLKQACTDAYLIAAAAADSAGDSFISYGGERLVNALATLRHQGNIYKEGLNPLGYDDRFIPMQDFSTLYNVAINRRNTASASQNSLKGYIREFDENAEKLTAAINALVTNPNGYKSQLATITGVSIYDGNFYNRVAAAGEDLYDCPCDDPGFSDCVAGKTTGVLGAKYGQIREMELRMQASFKRKGNLLAAVEREIQGRNEQIYIENIYNAAERDTLENYLDDMKNARTVQKQTTKKKGDKEKVTITTYYVENPELKLSIEKETGLQEALKKYRISMINMEAGKTIKNLLDQIAEAEIETGLSIQARNAAVMDFDNAMKEKDNLIFLYKKSLVQIGYDAARVSEKMPEVRILRCQSAIDLSRDLNNAVHFAYLAAKAIEYQYMKPLVNVTVLNETLNIHELYKVQTVEDLTRFLDKLNAYNACPWGSVAQTKVTVSLARNILGLSDGYLNPDNILSSAQVAKLRTQKVQAFISNHIDKEDNSLNLDFSTALTDNYISQFNKYNMKIWYGTLSAPCDPVPAKGVSVRFNTTQIQSIIPYVRLTQKGHSTYYDKDRKVLEYVPVGEYLNMLTADTGAPPATVGQFPAYVNEDPAAYPLWDPSFKGRSVSASDWNMRITDIGDNPIDWSKVADIYIFLDTINSNFLTINAQGKPVPVPAGAIEDFMMDETMMK